MDTVSRIISIRTGVAGPCPVCGEGAWSGDEPGEWLDQQTNHLIEAHGWRLLHIGQETATDADGKPWQHTVAVVGEPKSAEEESREYRARGSH